MPHTISPRLIGVAAAAAAFTLLPAVQVVHAAAAPYGSVIVAGADWAGADATMGDLNVYSNGSTSTGYYQCTELAMRFAAAVYGENPWWPVSSAAEMWGAGPTMPVPFQQLPNGGSSLPQFGDLVVFDVTQSYPQGHVAVVSGTAQGVVSVVEQNGSWTGRASLPINGTTMPPRQGSNQPIIGWLRAGAAPYVPNLAVPGGQVLDSWGGVHPFGSANQVSSPAYWAGWSIARDLVNLLGHPDSGYTLDGWGGVHAFGAAVPVQLTTYWRGWDVARKLVLRDDRSGYVLDAFGGLHAFGAAGDVPPPLHISAYWPGWDIARSLVLRSDGSSGYVLDGFGGLHPFGANLGTVPGLNSTAYWAGWNIARGVVLSSDGGGYVLDGFGAVHAVGSAAPVGITGYFRGDVARGLVVSGSRAGYVAFVSGAVLPFGGAPGVHVGFMGAPLGQAIG